MVFDRVMQMYIVTTWWLACTRQIHPNIARAIVMLLVGINYSYFGGDHTSMHNRAILLA